MSATLIPTDGLLLGRARVPGYAYPRIVTVRESREHNITAAGAATSRDVCERPDPAGYVAGAKGTDIGSVDALLANSWAEKLSDKAPSLPSPPAGRSAT